MTQSESNTPAYKVSDTVSIMRGIHRGQSATVIDVDTTNGQYAVKLTDGRLVVVNFVNVREPQEAVITASDLAACLGTFANKVPSGVITALENAAPGITDQFQLTEAKAEPASKLG